MSLKQRLAHSPYRRLACAVIVQAVKDLNTSKYREDAEEFLLSPDSPWFAMAGIPPETVNDAVFRGMRLSRFQRLADHASAAS